MQLSSVRWKIIIAYLLIIVVAFYVVATSLVRLVGDYLFSQKVREVQSIAEELAIRVAPALAEKNAEELYKVALDYSRKHGGRVLVLDGNGVVQVDSFSQLNGWQLLHSEVKEVLYGVNNSSYGYYYINNPKQQKRQQLLSFIRGANNDMLYGLYASAIVSNDKRTGVLLFSSPMQDMYDRLLDMQDQMIVWFVGVALFVVIMGMIMSKIVTDPIAQLSDSIQHIAKGDFSHRIHIKGYNEFAQLANAFNIMSERLENLDRSRNQFVSSASHELKTPLSTMKILLETLIYQEGFEKDLEKEFLNDINKEIDRLNLVISDLLTLVQIDSGEMRLRFTVLSLDQILADTVKRLSPLASERAIGLELSVGDQVMIEADSVKLQQVFYNLIDNAIKYTPRGGKVRVELVSNTKRAIVKVVDTGIGIPQNEIIHVFDRFYRVDKARSRETGGTGLGLSIVKQVVQLHGGTVNVQSIEDKGSTFTVELPL